MSQQILEKMRADTRKKEPFPSLVITPLMVDGYETVVEVTDKSVGLSALIAIHDTTLGPSLGGIRMFPYAKKEDALKDVLRLSRGMTYKASVAGVGFGGGKSVIIGNPKTEKTAELLRAFGEAVTRLQGKYICAEDVGISTTDVGIVRETTDYVVGLASETGSGNPSYFTAWGVFRGIQSVLKECFGTDSPEGKTIAIQGIGSVGAILADYLFWAGAKLIIADVDESALQRCAKKTGATIVSIEDIVTVPCDVFAPCALGGVLNAKNISLLQAKAVAGAANNQLLLEEDAELLEKRGILYAPDFVINAGGLLNVSLEVSPSGYDPRLARIQCHAIYDTLLAIYKIAKTQNISTHRAALFLAEDRVRQKQGKRTIPPVFHHSKASK